MSVTPLPFLTTDVVKDQARRLRKALAEHAAANPDLPGHSQTLELVARLHGYQSWGQLSAYLTRGHEP